MNRSFQLSLLVSLFTCGAVIGRDASADLVVVVRFVPHFVMTERIQTMVRDQIAHGLGSALQNLSRVEVVALSRAQPNDGSAIWSKAFDDGLDRLDPADFRNRSKTHFVQVEYTNGVFHVRSRQIDGGLGWCSPVVRDAMTSDREFVARAALSQLLLDYGLTGRVVASDGDRMANLHLEAGNLSDQAAGDWVKAGDVFAVTNRGAAVPDTWLVTTGAPTEGRVECHIESRYQRSLAGWEGGSFRAIKIGATIGRVRLRLILPNRVPASGMLVRLSATGFEKDDAVREQGDAVSGRFDSAERYDRMAYARIGGNGRTGGDLRVPLPVLSDAPVSVVIRPEGSDNTASVNDADVRACRSRLTELLARLIEERETANQRIARRDYSGFNNRVETLVSRINGELTGLEGEIAGLRGRPNLVGAAQISELQRLVADVKALREYFMRLSANVAKATEHAGTPEARRLREELLRRVAEAERLVHEADYDRAIEQYDAVVKQAGNWPEIEKRLAELREGWAVRSEAHRAARKFVYETWASLATVADFDRHLAKLREAKAECEKVGDRLTPRKIYLVLIQALTIANRQDADLLKSDAEDAARQLEQLRAFKARIAALLDDIERQIRPAG